VSGQFWDVGQVHLSKFDWLPFTPLWSPSPLFQVSEINLRNLALNHLTKWDVNHDGENVDHPSISAQSLCETLQQENQVYAKNDHHDEDVGRNQRV
jgi:hypothetical protein